MKSYLRLIKKNVTDALNHRRIAIISGARQVGKTTLAKQFVTKDNPYFTLDNDSILKTVKDDPFGFVQHTKGTMIIDEIQKAPELISAIKMVVDEDNRYGQFLLTGSANLFLLPEVKESLAGRVKNITLYTLTQAELLNRPAIFISKAFENDFPIQLECSKNDVLMRAVQGGYPEIIGNDEIYLQDWHNDYMDTLLKHDLSDILNIRRTDAMKKLTYTLAAWSSKLIDLSGICNSLEINKITLNSYLNALEAMHLFSRLTPWTDNDYDYIVKKEKMYLNDSGLMCSILNTNFEKIKFDSDQCGKVVETFIFHELSALCSLNSDYTLSHYRDHSGHEIDFIIENKDHEMLCIEAKAGSVIEKSDFKHINWFRETFGSNRKITGIVLYSGTNTLHFGEGNYAVPTSILWN